MSHLYGKGGRLLGIFLLVVLAVGGLVIFAKAEGPTEGALTIYSGRREVFMKPLMDDFQKRTGVKLSVKYGRVGELANTIILEKENPVADIFLTTEPATLEALRRRGLLQGYVSPNAAPIPALYKDPDGTWTGLVGRVRVIMHNKNLIKEEALPKSLFELTDPKWKG
ncbi:MAG: extracellular solute-binding protein, partial [Candidatus Tectomicrobia bacterium]|nr:extracellular solute-binding protein [Candidatus Tectomicrobia bacterium]